MGVPRDATEALKWYTLAAEQGHAESQFNLGIMYGKGEGVRANWAESMKWFMLAAEQGHAIARQEPRSRPEGDDRRPDRRGGTIGPRVEAER